MYVGHVDVKKANYFEVDEVFDSWKKEIITWQNDRIQIKVPETTNRGPLVVSVQKRISSNKSLSAPDNYILFGIQTPTELVVLLTISLMSFQNFLNLSLATLLTLKL